MKRFNYIAFLAAVAAAVSCEVSEPMEGPHDGLVSYNVTAEAEWSEFVFTSESEDSKTVYSPGSEGNPGTILWSSGDQIRMGYTVNGAWQGTSGNASQSNPAKLYASEVLTTGGPTASFRVPGNFTGIASGTYSFYTVYPASAAAEDFTTPTGITTTVTIPTVQTPAAASFDPAADLMIGQSVAEYSSRPTEPIPLSWKRKVAHGEITLKNLKTLPGFSTSETIQSVTLTAQSGAALTGTFTADLTSPEGALTPSDASNSVTVSGTNLSWGGTSEDPTLTFWISIFPETITSLDVVLVTESGKIYSKTYRGFTRIFKGNAHNTLGISMTNYYVKVTGDQDDWSGDYLIVYEGGNGANVAFNGGLTSLDVTSNTISVTFDSNNRVVRTATTAAAQFTIAKSGNNYTVKSHSGYYIGQTSNANGMTANQSTSYSHTISYNGSSTDLVSGGAYLRYNSNSDQTRFRYFKSSTYTAQKVIQLYKLDNVVGATAPIIPDPDPEATATVTTGNVTKGETTATLNASFSGNTGTVSETGFYWGTSNNPSTKIVVGTGASVTSQFSTGLTGLTAGTTYYYKAYVLEYDGVEGAPVERCSAVASFTTNEAAQVMADYELVTATQSDWSGYYVLGYLASSSSAILLTGVNSSNIGSISSSITVSSNKIAYSAGSNYEVTIAKTTNGYSIRIGGKYLRYSGSGNNLYADDSFAENTCEWTFSYSGNGKVTIANVESTSRVLQYNTGSPRFACYTGSQQTPSLFKRAGSSTPQVTVTTEAVSNLANTSVTLNGSYVVPTGLSVTERGFYFGTGSDPTTKITVSGTDTSFSISKTGLTKGTAYSYKAYAIESNGTTTTTRYGEVVYFTTTGGSQVTYQYLSDYGMPDISGLGVSLRTSGTNSDRDDKWYSYNTNNNKRQIAVHTYSTGAPNNSETCNYVVLYDETKYAPVWTAHTMNSTYWPNNNAGRNNSWTNDPAISLTQQTGLDNASTVGYSRGHLVASNYRQTTDEQNKQTFYYSNQAPQWQNSFNSGVWSSLETRVVEMTPSGTTMLYVITGVLYEGTITTLSSGSLNVPIPSHFYKCIMRCTFSGGTISGAQGIAFVYTNEAHSGNYYNSAFVTTIDAIEARAGFDFFSAVPTTYQTSAESNTNHTWFTGQN